MEDNTTICEKDRNVDIASKHSPLRDKFVSFYYDAAIFDVPDKPDSLFPIENDQAINLKEKLHISRKLDDKSVTSYETTSTSSLSDYSYYSFVPFIHSLIEAGLGFFLLPFTDTVGSPRNVLH
eukprot:15365280-Ditylum_brightwellii.AAC.1